MTKGIILGLDLGTGGCKGALARSSGEIMAVGSEAYPTAYPAPGWHEQRPHDWWDAAVRVTRGLIGSSSVDAREIMAVAISGHSLVPVLLNESGDLLQESVPIWSDVRAVSQTEQFFSRYPEQKWYLMTGNGFPPPHYSIFKLMWLAENDPELFEQAVVVLGSKDYLNYRLTGVVATDHTYASGSGIYDLCARDYVPALIEASGLRAAVFPRLVESTEILGGLQERAALQLGLRTGTPIVAGGVDNSCMALGAGAVGGGIAYLSLGSSSWVTVAGPTPVLEPTVRPYVFAHAVPRQFLSALSTFSSGSALQWAASVLGAASVDGDVGALLAEAKASPPGANGLLFLPMLAGGTALEGGAGVRGAMIGLDLRHTKADLGRSVMEGIAMAMRLAFDTLHSLTKIKDPVVVVGGGARDNLWGQIYADILGLSIAKISVDQAAAAVGAIAIAAVATGEWRNFEEVGRFCKTTEFHRPTPTNRELYDSVYARFRSAIAANQSLGGPSIPPTA